MKMIATSIVRSTLGFVLSLLCGFAANGGEVRLSASVQQDMAESFDENEPPQYLLVAESDPQAALLAGTIGKYISNFGYRDGRILSFATPKIGNVLNAISKTPGAVTIDRAPQLGREEIERASTVPFNKNAQLSHNVSMLKSEYQLSGRGVAVGVWDSGSVLNYHVEFDDRVEMREPDLAYTAHATHVAGTIAAKGKNPDAEGMAPESRIYSFGWDNDIEELRTVARTEPSVHVTNHSYAAFRGWSYSNKRGRWEWHGDPRISQTEDYWFGKYHARSAEIDAVVLEFPQLNIVVAAGNDRDPNAHPKVHDSDWKGRHWLVNSQRYVSGPSRPADRQHDHGYDTLEGFAVAKNVITIGAMEDVPFGRKLEPATVLVTAFSNWGPTDDGRIKPDLVANGADLRSPSLKRLGDGFDDRGYANKDGTSMASPAVAGVAALLTELSIRHRGRPLRADEMKAILVSTAISPQIGPSYRTGWGAIDALCAGRMVAGDNGTVFTRKALTESTEIRVSRTAEPASVTMTWIDPPAPANSGGLNDRMPSLVLDFDLLLIDDNNRAHFPWSLNPDAPAAIATNSGPNKRDNVERIDVSDGSNDASVWTIRIAAPRSAIGHEVAIAIRGLKLVESAATGADKGCP